MAVTGIIERTVDINYGVVQEDLHRLFAVADAQAHTFKITVNANGVAQSLSGHTVIGYFMRNAGGTVVINGSVSGNVATLVLPQSCYSIIGGFQLIIRLVSGSTKTAIYWASGYITRSTTDPIIDPGSVVPDLDDVLAMIDEVDVATAAATAAAADANTAASKSVRYDTAQSLTTVQQAQAKSNIGLIIDNTLTTQGAAADAKKVGDEISDLKGDLDNIVPGLTYDAKEALLDCFLNVAWANTHGQDYIDALKRAIDYDDSTVLYKLKNYIDDYGSSLDTGINLLSEDRNFTVAIDVTLDESLNSKGITNYSITQSIYSVSPYDGLEIKALNDQSKHYPLTIQWMGKWLPTDDFFNDFNDSFTGRARIIVTHAIGSDLITCICKFGNGAKQIKSISQSFTVKNRSNVRLGGNSSGSQRFAGSFSKYIIDSKVWNSDEIDQFLS